MRITRKAVWRGGRVYIKYSKAITRQVQTARKDVERIRHFATDPLAFHFDFEFNEGDV